MEEQTALPKVIEWKQRDIPHCTEIENELAFPGSGGAPVRVRMFMRKIDLGDSYMVFNHLSRNSEAAQTFIVTGTKGEVEGDYREDQVENVFLLADGTVLRTGPQTVKVLLNAPYAGLSPEEILQQFGKDHPVLSCPMRSSTDDARQP
jgi:hypothetical protein